MKFFELQESMACTPFLLHFLQILGLRRGEGHAGLLRFVGGLLAGWTILWIPKAFFGFGDELDLNIRGYSELLFMFNIDARAIIFYLNIAKLDEFVDLVQNVFDQVTKLSPDSTTYTTILKSNQALDRIAKTYVIFAAVAGVVFSPNMNALNLLVLLILITSQTFLLCQYGNELTEESFAVATEAYNAQWTELPVDVQKGVGLILQRAQKWEGITAARFYQVNVERFGAMVQTSYSIYVVLKDRLASKT
ncbi:hypothetical protein pipiens_015098 [Culex pipiens pipiens]|uniref:Odorant receptor n=1 Tax=Culex pipiens pipiens TaxID=38569 RepID=A0ABD1CTV8_CULPP